MRNIIGGMTFIAGMMGASAALAGPLTNILLNSLDGKAEIKWVEGYQQGKVETLSDVILKFTDGRRVDISVLELDFQKDVIVIDAQNVRVNPEADVLLLRADSVVFRGGPAQLKSFWNFDMINDACHMVGPQASLEVGGLGVIVAAPNGTIDEDSTYRAARMEVRQKSTGTSNACTTSIGFTMQGYQAIDGEGASTVSNHLEVEALLPGSLASLAADPEQTVSLKIEATESGKLINGGATAWAIDEGMFNAEFSALGLVPAMTHILKNRGTPRSSKFWMEIWNSIGGAKGDFNFDVDSMTLRSANVLPPERVTQFADGGLTTVILSGRGKTSMNAGEVKTQADVSVTGLMSVSLQSNLRMGKYPDAAIAKQMRSPDMVNLIVPVYVDQLRYEQSDDGLVDAAAAIMGMPVTVLINQIREEQAAKNKPVSGVIRDVATAAANFFSISYRQSPARLDLSVDPELDLREAVIVARSLPGEILKIFDFTVGTGAQ